MSSIQEDLFPDHRLVIQTVIFLVTLFFANLYIIKPALRLSNERKRRTSGAIDMAKGEIARAESLESAYDSTFKSKMDEIRALRTAEIQAGQAEAHKVLAEAQGKSEAHLAQVKTEIQSSIADERKKIPATVSDIVSSLMQRIGASAALLGLAAAVSTALQNAAFAAGGGSVDTMEGIAWPYLQFVVFFAAIVYFGNKVIHSILESRRENLRVKLTEATQALTDAQRKASEYQTKMNSMTKELEDVRRSYLQDSAKEREKIVAEARALAEQMNKDSERTARELISRGKEELRKEVLDQAFKALDEKITPDVAKNLNQKLNDEAMAGIGKLAVH